MAKKSDSDSNGGNKLAPKRLAEKLRAIRQYLQINQSEMPVIINPNEECGRNRARISQYESSVRLPSRKSGTTPLRLKSTSEC